jgi:hypothetical protein
MKLSRFRIGLAVIFVFIVTHRHNLPRKDKVQF